MILSSITACEATAMILLLYSANLLLSSVQLSSKQWWLRNSLPRIKGLVNPSQTTNLYVKLHGLILKLTMTEPFTPISCPLAVLILTLLSEIWWNNPSAATVSYLMQLTCASVSNSEVNIESFTLILNVVPLVLPVWMNNTSLLLSAPLL